MDGELEHFESARFEGVASRRRICLKLIGEFRAETPDGRSLLPPSRKARALLCIIGMARPQGALRAVAGALLWSSKHREAVANSLRAALGDLQPLLLACGRPYILATKRGRLVLDPESVWIDVLDMTPEQAAEIDQSDPANMLCRDLRGISPTFDAYLDRLWVEIGYRRALTPAPDSRLGGWRGVGHSGAITGHGAGRLPSDPQRLFGPPTVSGLSLEKLDRFPQTLTAEADIATHQLGWRMAVLPFRSLGAPLGRGIALGMAEEVSAALGRFRAPRLVATATFWDGTGPAIDAMSRCRASRLDYIIDGTIQVVGNRVRVTVTLLDVVLDFEVIWSHRFEGNLDDLFSLQDKIASETVAQVDPELYQRRWAAQSVVKTGIPEAHRLVLTAIQDIFRLDRPRYLRARELLARAIELDCDFAAAHAWMAYWALMAVGFGWVDHPREVVALAGRSAEQAVLLDGADARAVAVAGHVKAYLQHDVKAALRLHEDAISKNPNLPVAWAASAWSKVYSGDHATALRHAAMAQMLSPRDPHIFFSEHAAIAAHLFRRELDEAAAIAETGMNQEYASALRLSLSVFGHLQRKEECAEMLNRLKLLKVDVSLAAFISLPPYSPDDLAYYAAGLRLAGVTE